MLGRVLLEARKQLAGVDCRLSWVDVQSPGPGRILGWTDAGVLQVGARADLVAVDLHSVRTAGGGATAETVVFAASAADVTDVVVDGAVVVADRKHVRVDVAAELHAAIANLLEDA